MHTLPLFFLLLFSLTLLTAPFAFAQQAGTGYNNMPGMNTWIIQHQENENEPASD